MTESRDPYTPPKEKSRPPLREPQSYAEVPLLRRNGFCSTVIIAHLIATFASVCHPALQLLTAVTTIGVIVVCFIVLTGPVYYNKSFIGRPLGPGERSERGLDKWGNANKVAAVIILLIILLCNGFMLFPLLRRTIF